MILVTGKWFWCLLTFGTLLFSSCWMKHNEFTMPVYKPGGNQLLEIVHVALMGQPKVKGSDLSVDDMMACIG